MDTGSVRSSECLHTFTAQTWGRESPATYHSPRAALFLPSQNGRVIFSSLTIPPDWATPSYLQANPPDLPMPPPPPGPATLPHPTNPAAPLSTPNYLPRAINCTWIRFRWLNVYHLNLNQVQKTFICSQDSPCAITSTENVSAQSLPLNSFSVQGRSVTLQMKAAL